jgi:hypothetical protein
MRRLIPCTLSMLLLFISLPAFACGGGFGQQVTINPSQNIVLSYRGGVETYIFQPHFCGSSTDFGLILPVPSTLTQNPTLGDASLVSQLEVITAAHVEVVEVCASGGLFTGSSKSSDGAGFSGQAAGVNGGVNVISTGQVGQFQWQLLKADSVTNFTDWLDANKFPYSANAQPAFDHYVQAGWYFVAFSVTAGANAPPSGYKLCGDFGPIQLSFQTSQAVIPASIAAASDTQYSFTWRIFTVSSHELNPSTASTSASVSQSLRFAGALTTDSLTGEPAVAKIGSAGEWLTESDVSFYSGGLTQDIWLQQAPIDTAFRRTEYVQKEVSCGVLGCSVNRNSAQSHQRFAGLFAIAAICGLATLRRKTRQS